MKQLKLVLWALIAVTGVGSAWGSRTLHNERRTSFNTFYYAVTDGAGSFIWTTLQPDWTFSSCESYWGAYCTVLVVNGFTPIDGEPIPYADIILGPSQEGIYR